MTKHALVLASCLICALFMPLAARAVTVPAGTPLLVRTLGQVSSSDTPGKTFAAVLDTDLVAQGETFAKAGTKVYGRVDSSRSAGRALGRSKLAGLKCPDWVQDSVMNNHPPCRRRTLRQGLTLAGVNFAWGSLRSALAAGDTAAPIRGSPLSLRLTRAADASLSSAWPATLSMAPDWPASSTVRACSAPSW